MAIKAGLAAVLLMHIVQGYPYSSYSDSGRRYNRAYNSRPPYVPVPFTYSMPHTYQEDNQPPENSYSPYYSYYPYRTNRRASWGDDSEQSDYQAGYYPPAPNAAATREAILQNLIIGEYSVITFKGIPNSRYGSRLCFRFKMWKHNLEL